MLSKRRPAVGVLKTSQLFSVTVPQIAELKLVGRIVTVGEGVKATGPVGNDDGRLSCSITGAAVGLFFTCNCTKSFFGTSRQGSVNNELLAGIEHVDRPRHRLDTILVDIEASQKPFWKLPHSPDGLP